MQLVTHSGRAVLGRETLPSDRPWEGGGGGKERGGGGGGRGTWQLPVGGGDPPWVQDTQQGLKDPLNKDSLGKCLLHHAAPRRAPHWPPTSTGRAGKGHLWVPPLWVQAHRRCHPLLAAQPGAAGLSNGSASLLFSLWTHTSIITILLLNVFL